MKLSQLAGLWSKDRGFIQFLNEESAFRSESSPFGLASGDRDPADLIVPNARFLPAGTWTPTRQLLRSSIANFVTRTWLGLQKPVGLSKPSAQRSRSCHVLL